MTSSGAKASAAHEHEQGDHQEEAKSPIPVNADSKSAHTESYPPWHNAVAGATAGFGSRMVTAPLDLIRIRRQLNLDEYPSRSILQSWQAIARNEGGVAALYRGNIAAIYLWVGYAAIQFSMYNQVKEVANNSFVAGAVAGLAATLVTYPFDVCRTTFAARGIHTANMPFSSLMEPPLTKHGAFPGGSTTAPTSLWHFASDLYSRKGAAGFYAGVTPAFVLIIPYMGLNFWLYEKLAHRSNRPLTSVYAGSIAGAFSKCVVYPLDTVKRRLQAQAFYTTPVTMNAASNPATSYLSMTDCFQRILKEEGFLAFYRGVVPSVLKTTLASGLSFGLFRGTKNALETIHNAQI